MALPLTTSLGDAKEWLRRRVEEGECCPLCGQHAKVYKRKVNSGMARSLISMYRAGGTSWVHLPTQVGARSREEGKLRYWGLVEEKPEDPTNGASRAGFWRVTEVGELFLQGKVRIYKYARVYNGRCLGLQGDLVDIKEALGDKFDYEELMSL